MTRMIERWFPCQEVSEHSAGGWGSGNSEANLFTWFAKRPLAQARAAVVCSLLPWPDDETEQRRLQRLVRGSFADINANHDELVAELAKHYPDGASMLDPFSGRAMFPLEAARLGVKAWGIDYSPVATLAGKLLADYPLRDWDSEPPLPFTSTSDDDSGQLLDDRPRLLRDVATVLDVIGDRYEQAMDDFYPRVNGKRPWGYLWAVTLPCQECGNRFPLTGSLVLRHPLPKKNDPGQSYRIEADPATGTFEAVVHEGPPTGTPTLGAVKGKRGKSATCPFCAHVHSIDVHTRMMNDGLAEDALLVVADLDDNVGKTFRSPTPPEIDVLAEAQKALADEPPFGPGLPAVPDEPIPPGNNHTVRPSKYGYRTYGDLCVPRQTLGFVRLARVIDEVAAELVGADLTPDYTGALVGYAGANLVRRMKNSTRGCRLRAHNHTSSNRVQTDHVFVNEASIAFSYDNFETGAGDGPGTWRSVTPDTVATLRSQLDRPLGRPAEIERGTALSLPNRPDSLTAVVTDPPYDSMIDYSDASDLFYVWLKRALLEAVPEFGLTGDPRGLQDKADEIIVKDSYKAAGDHRTPEFYEDKIAAAFAEASRVVVDDGVVTIVFGHGDPEVWHRLLSSISVAGLVLTGSWPARTEKGGKAGSANIETTLTLACRPIPAGRKPGRVADVDAEVRREIEARIPLWDSAGLALTDQLMASAGPAMEVVGRYSEVLDKAGDPVALDRYLPLARRFVEEAAGIRIDSLPLETFDPRTHFALFWVRLYGRTVAAASEARWQKLSADLPEHATDGILVKADKGTRLAYGDEKDRPVDTESPVIDVALALAAAGKTVAGAAEILVASGRGDDDYLWAALSDLQAGRLLPDGDRDKEVWTWLVRNRNAVIAATANVEAARAREAEEAENAERQTSLFEGSE